MVLRRRTAGTVHRGVPLRQPIGWGHDKGDELRAGKAPGALAGVLGAPPRAAAFAIGWGLKAEVAAIALMRQVPDLTGVLMMPNPKAGQ